jgi:hypothetical protein
MRNVFDQLDDGSVISSDGRVLLYSISRFIQEIVKQDRCFICGSSSTEAFTKEHILPDWVLRRYNLHEESITLPNSVPFKYGRYVIPCCEPCNRLMGKEIEERVRPIVEGGHKRVKNWIDSNGYRLIFVWLSLIFIKAHLKDKQFRWSLDARQDKGKISERFVWEQVHHIYCVARSFYVDSVVAENVLGTLLVFPIKDERINSEFDYGDLYSAQCSMIRLGDLAFICVFNDSRAVEIALRQLLKRIDYPLSIIQLRELWARASYINMRVRNKPSYMTAIYSNGTQKIVGKHDDVIDLADIDEKLYGTVLYTVLRDYLSSVGDAELTKHVKNGIYTFLFDENGKFIH